LACLNGYNAVFPPITESATNRDGTGRLVRPHVWEARQPLGYRRLKKGRVMLPRVMSAFLLICYISDSAPSAFEMNAETSAIVLSGHWQMPCEVSGPNFETDWRRSLV